MSRSIYWLTALFVAAATIPLLAQVTLLPVVLDPHHPGAEAVSNVGTVSLVWAFFSSTAMEWVKRHKALTVLTTETSFLTQRAVGVLLAVAAASGVHASFNAEAGILTFTGLAWTSLRDALGDSLRQWVLQELIYRNGVKGFGATATTFLTTTSAGPAPAPTPIV